ncbi:MAG: DoxX family protein [Bacteroidales bacterium]
MRIIRTISFIIVGIVLVFSGIVKGIDPLGTAYKLQDYFVAFGMQSLRFLGLPLSILLCTVEFITGISLLTGAFRKAGIVSAFIMFAFFTPLTLVLAISNPVSDCGCFGDAIHLTNWQTFGKNLFLVFFVLLLFFSRDTGMVTSRKKSMVILISSVLLFFIFTWYNLRYLPVIDFLPYSVGTSIPEKMKIPEGAPAGKYESIFIYEKDGVRKEFTIDNYPANDSTWKFVETKTTITEKGYIPEIHDFSITGMNGEDLTDSVLSSKGYTLLMISRKLKKAGEKEFLEGMKVRELCTSNGVGFLVLTSSPTTDITELGTDATICTTDDTTLKTIARSDPGFLLIKNGIIIGKWSLAGLPGSDKFRKIIVTE